MHVVHGPHADGAGGMNPVDMPLAPTVRSYARWAEAQGCTLDAQPVTRGGQDLTALAIRSPAGAVALEIFMEWEDPLMSTTIARLDRRLGIKSHLFR